ncbi:MAG TPA: S8 family serine peptidase [bacterium]|nr:S8 family serine peptidase [bacterium]
MKIKKIKFLLPYCLIIILLILGNFFSIPVKAISASNILPPHQSGELLIKLKNSQQIYKFKFQNDNELQELIKFYQEQKDVELVEPNYLYQAALIPNDQYYDEQWYLEKIQAPNAWNITTGTNLPIIAIIDSGVDIDHPDLKNNIWTNSKEIANNGIDDDQNGFTDDFYGWDFVDNNNNVKPTIKEPYSDIGLKHGTVVAGVVAAEGGNKEGVAGISWHAKIMVIKALDNAGVGDTLTVSKAIDYARVMGANIINLSFVGEGNSQTLETAIKQAYEADIMVVAAAGNEVKDGVNMNTSPRYPACHNGPNGDNWVIAVGSLDANDVKASFSNYGSNCLDISAPGVGIFSTVYYNNNNDKYKKYYERGWTGTSVSAPQIAGAAALIKSLRPELPFNQIKKIILQNTDNIDETNKNLKGFLGNGRLNLIKSISNALMATPETSIQPKRIITSPVSAGGPHIKIFRKGILEQQFFAHDEKFRGGLSLAGYTTNEQLKIVVGLGKGTYPWIKIFSNTNTLIEKMSAFAENFRGGVEVTAGQVNADKEIEIVATAGVSGGPQIRIFNELGLVKSSWFAFDKKERTGLNLTLSDMDRDGLEEIIVVRKSGLSEIKIFDFWGNLKKSFYPYGNKFYGSLNIASGDLDNDGFGEIVTVKSTGVNPEIKIFDHEGKLKSSFFPFVKKTGNGANIALGDVNGDGLKDIVVGSGIGMEPQVKVFNMNGVLELNFLAYDKRFRGGVKVAVEK